MLNKNQIETQRYSSEVQEILNHVPNWIARSGICLILGIIIISLILSWLIKYPDNIKGVVIFATHPFKDRCIDFEDELLEKNYILQQPYIVQIKINKDDYKKSISVGEKVRLRINHLSDEYDVLIGNIESVLPLIEENIYVISIKLNNKVESLSYKEFNYISGITTVEVITEDIRIIDRQLRQLNEFLSNRKDRSPTFN